MSNTLAPRIDLVRNAAACRGRMLAGLPSPVFPGVSDDDLSEIDAVVGFRPSGPVWRHVVHSAMVEAFWAVRSSSLVR